jgi:hypothetical protein
VESRLLRSPNKSLLVSKLPIHKGSPEQKKKILTGKCIIKTSGEKAVSLEKTVARTR